MTYANYQTIKTCIIKVNCYTNVKIGMNNTNYWGNKISKIPMKMINVKIAIKRQNQKLKLISECKTTVIVHKSTHFTRKTRIIIRIIYCQKSRQSKKLTNNSGTIRNI